MRALANEKYARFKEKYGKLGIKVAISTGDFDSVDFWLADYDLIILTSEKTDSLLRHKAAFLHQVGVAVIDECHLITDVGRGPTLEVAITRLRKLNPKMLFLLLSATIANANELAEWLNAKLIKSDFRPVKLHEGVYFENQVYFDEKPAIAIDGDDNAEVLLAENTAKIGKQALVFASSRRNAEAIAERCSKALKKTLTTNEISKLKDLSKDVVGTLESATPQCGRLAMCIESGAAFHHAGLVAKQRVLVEDAFRNKLIKVIAATPTLAAGVDLPAYRVLIRDARRYSPGAGFAYIPVLEYEQMRGRAGRPRYDKEGESILLAHSEAEARELYNRFVLGEPEEIQSKLAVEPVLRMHLLSLIATETACDEQELESFFSQTFWGHQFRDMKLIKEKLVKILKQLLKWNLISQNADSFSATKLGQRVSELYIDPLTAHNFIVALQDRHADEFGLLQLMANSAELSPPLRVKKREYDLIMNELAKKEQKLMTNIPKEWDLEYEDFVDSVKTALAFEDWLDEYGEEMLYRKYGVTPGELHSKREIADWLLYAIEEISKILNKTEAVSTIRKLRIRMHYGIREELLQLVRLKGIGRMRARKLFAAGHKTIADLRKATVIELAPLIGTATAENILKQISDSNSLNGAVV